MTFKKHKVFTEVEHAVILKHVLSKKIGDKLTKAIEMKNKKNGKEKQEIMDVVLFNIGLTLLKIHEIGRKHPVVSC